MKIIIYLLLICSFTYACAQQKIEKPPRYKLIKPKKSLPNQKGGHLILNLGELKENADNLYCFYLDGKCKVIDGEIKLYSPQIARGDNASVTERLYAEGEFLEGKFQGIWKYYDESRKVIKKEKWDNGRLIYRKEYK